MPNFSQISRAHGKFGEQNKALESSLLIINYHIFINKYYNYIINAYCNYYISNKDLLEECDKDECKDVNGTFATTSV